MLVGTSHKGANGVEPSSPVWKAGALPTLSYTPIRRRELSQRKSGWGASIPRPSTWRADALPTELHPRADLSRRSGGGWRVRTSAPLTKPGTAFGQQPGTLPNSVNPPCPVAVPTGRSETRTRTWANWTRTSRAAVYPTSECWFMWWLRNLGSNQGFRIQSAPCCPYAIPQSDRALFHLGYAGKK